MLIEIWYFGSNRPLFYFNLLLTLSIFYQFPSKKRKGFIKMHIGITVLICLRNFFEKNG